ncbi:MAG: TIGR00730 family Rossman fold protein [Chloroflexi bacterium]|nr:TIGR00730 family Rossman fold protein [Chloroflexota bacterium]
MSYPYRSLCVFCGSADGIDQVYSHAAYEVGKIIAEKGITLVFGAGRTGLMGFVAKGALEHHGEVIGVVPVGLESPQLIYMSGLSRLEIVDNIQLRKARMNALADGFIALPGGFGTMDEAFEVLTWSQIGLHRKPIAFLNVGGYFDPLISWLDRAFLDRFIYAEHLDLFVIDPTPTGIFEKLEKFKFPDNIGRWLTREE